jgi:tetratricopeptide (TPR) repeat protein
MAAHLSERFELREILGAGGFGTVYAAYDRDLSGMVALKVLSRAHPEAILAFKREFRELTDVHHPNLVQLRELLCEDGQWVLVMELVRGEDLLDYVRRDPDPHSTCNDARLRQALIQLVHGLSAVHAAGRVHRDIKPSNVRVTPEGRSVLLDFGLVMRADVTVSSIGGTVAYMAPEQAGGETLGPAADFYALGVMIYEALTGSLPYVGGQLEVLLAKQKGHAPSLRPRFLALAATWDPLIQGLLDPRPERRPTARRILEALSRGALDSVSLSIAPTTQSSLFGGATLVGRHAELSRLERAFARVGDGELAYTAIFGESGIGKTRLMDAALDLVRARDDRMLLLCARCYENETVAFKALDALVDAIVHELRRMPYHVCVAILPRRAALLPYVFPSMARVRAIAEMQRTRRADVDRITLRAHVFEALRELLGRLAEHQRTVVVIDDIQWADAESMELLCQLFRPPQAPPLCLITLCRPKDQCSSEVIHGLKAVSLADEGYEELDLSRLDLDDSIALSLELMQDKNEAWARAIAAEADGQPLFIEILVRHAEAVREAKTLDEALSAYVESLNAAARKLLELCAVAGMPLPRTALLEASDIDGEVFATELARLRLGRLLRTSRGREGDAVEPFHDRVRTSVLGGLSEDTLRARHRRVALVLDAIGSVDRERVAQHWFSAGATDRAADSALMAAEQASEGLAFGKAARLYGWAVSLRPELREDRHTLMRWGDALANAGRSSEAADVLIQAVAGSSAAEAIDLKRRCAELLIQSGRLTEGLALADELCRSVGLSFPRTRGQALRQLVWYSLRRSVKVQRDEPRPPENIAHADLIKMDVLWSLASRLGPIDPFVSGALQTQHYLLALDAREPGRLAQALASDVFAQFFRGKTEGIDACLKRASALAEKSGRPDVRAFVLYMRAASYAMGGEAERALGPYQEAELTLASECTGVGWLLGTTRTSIIHVAKELGRWDLIAQRYPRVLLDARERGDPYLHNHTVLSAAHVYGLMHDRPEQAVESVQLANAWAGNNAHAVYQNWMAQLSIRTYQRDPGAFSDALAGSQALASTGTMRMPALHAGVKLRVGLVALAEMKRRPADASALGRVAARARSELSRTPESTCRNTAALLLEAALHDAKSDCEGAISAYEKAEQAALSSGRMNEADVARARRGQLLGAAGRALVSDVEQRVRQQGIRQPLRFLDAMLPGVLPLD